MHLQNIVRYTAYQLLIHALRKIIICTKIRLHNKIVFMILKNHEYYNNRLLNLAILQFHLFNPIDRLSFSKSTDYQKQFVTITLYLIGKIRSCDNSAAFNYVEMLVA